MGMSEDERNEATSRFNRGQGAEQMAAGSGLGLSLVERVIEKHGGELRLESVPGEGTRVTIILPAASSPEDK